MAFVFLSYDHEDGALARPLAAALEKAGHQVWYDRQIHGGAQYTQKIEQALNSADAVIVLWSEKSLQSAWVRDEAAEGRDRNKLVPLSTNSVTPPMGFRQFQTIDLGDWKGRGKVPHLAEIVRAIESQAVDAADQSEGSVPSSMPAAHAPAFAGVQTTASSRPAWLVPAAAIALVAAAGFGAWRYFAAADLPEVSVAAADPSPASRAAARELFVKLGGLAQVGDGRWTLVEADDDKSKADLAFKTSASGSPGSQSANLVLIDTTDNSLLWSHEFSAGQGQLADLHEQLAMTAGRVLGCALESREGKLDRSLAKIFLDACASMAEVGWDKQDVFDSLRRVTDAKPDFTPAWSRLLIAELDTLDFNDPGNRNSQTDQLKKDIRDARKADPAIPEATYAEASLMKTPPIEPVIAKLDAAIQGNNRSPVLLNARSGWYFSVGRLDHAVLDAKRASELDPLSAEAKSYYIQTLGYAGQIDAARRELEAAEKTWPNANTIKETRFSLDFRFGDFEKTLTANTRYPPAATRRYIAMRKDPSATNVAQFFSLASGSGFGSPQLIFGSQAFGEINRPDKVFELFALPNAPKLDPAQAYFLFRPYMKSVRDDPRFMKLAASLGLVEYWRKSGVWPDYCAEPDVPYVCEEEAAKYVR